MEAALHNCKQVARFALDALLPPQCLSCGALAHEPGALCASCWEQVSYISDPHCYRCGFPFEVSDFSRPEETLCGGCSSKAPAFHRARSVLVYDDASRNLILRFKHADRTEGAPAFARWMARTGAGLIAEADVIVPVPLHRWRLFSRRYNQSALLSAHLADQTDTEFAPSLLVRHRNTQTQGGLDRRGRTRNVQGAFFMGRGPDVAGKRVLLIDDVLTTGATVSECAKVLKRAGAADVDVLTLARVI